MEKRDRLPYGDNLPEAEPFLEACRLTAEPHSELGAVDDVHAGERLGECEVPVADNQRGEVTDASFRQSVSERLYPDPR